MTDDSPPEPEADVRLDTAALRVLAHPLRINVLTMLRQRGPSTATRVADELGINPGSASYHLRRLALGGLIVEEPGRGTGRERWWRAAHRQSQHDPASGPPEEREAGRPYAHAVALAGVDRLRRAADEIPLLPREWLDVSAYADFVLWLTPERAGRVKAEIFEVFARLREEAEHPVEGAVPVALQLQVFPVPGTVAPLTAAPGAQPDEPPDEPQTAQPDDEGDA
ncbi:helix-turn-helix domain-containing protein [Streptomyces sp. CBMA29]|uniref:helix-turn-helix domain-containing protein n=1 Tax=Streptomyces sp. CBMA29 TaxID=1896314 RepID=UPI001661FF4E|nr:helix-turn-helix domain-containing protein [Streptomyces sp. CBMA29]MBD0738832.1 ArsR family transcriptional regulator [Streptomyces sp. CBMA29]